ncbi:methylmalonyl Co-A mutase-associated GTPase MeaB [Candidatus Formimonas warabiya]|uniref:GTPase n=1 Tax=Formimonas warabiya TaxID=1761012 RepID=A0A3G1KSS1_FORW1|nr:methylmalonyl Co-A mutase-associated GTPase MeaB [Candidatus Formimonas warabiya]ATW25499.1 GTPase [Candidatus Formimonas warabiya]
MDDLVKRVLNGDRRAAARMISLIENDEEAKNELMSKIYPCTGHAYIIGITGSPGAGKSSLTDKLVGEIRRGGLTVAIIAIDPTSPFTGGAILGDRIRMQSHALDAEVFIRSMGTRGSLGGLSHATNEAAKVMDALKKDIIIIETVGVGQSEFDIMHIANSTLVVLTPGAGDAIQTIKAGIMEIADIFVVNKSDLDGADRVKMEVEVMLDMKQIDGWRPPVVPTVSLNGKGVQELWLKIMEHKSFLESSGLLLKQRKKRLREEVREIVEHEIRKHVWTAVEKSGEMDKLVAQMMQREMDPYTAAKRLIAAHLQFR